MKQPNYNRNTESEHVNLFKREREIYSQIKIDRRKFKISLVLFFVILVIIVCVVLCNPSKKPISPVSILDKEQTVELQSYHSDKGLVTVDDGFVTIKTY